MNSAINHKNYEQKAIEQEMDNYIRQTIPQIEQLKDHLQKYSLAIKNIEEIEKENLFIINIESKEAKE